MPIAWPESRHIIEGLTKGVEKGIEKGDSTPEKVAYALASGTFGFFSGTAKCIKETIKRPPVVN